MIKKNLYIFILFFSATPFKATAQDTVQLNNLSAYIGRKVKLVMPVVDFDLRSEYIYLYMGNRYPEQQFTVIIKRNYGKKRIRLSKGVILGQEAVSLTGYISVYDGEPDTTKNVVDVAIKKGYEKGRPVVIVAFNQPATLHHVYKPRTGPIDLRSKLIMMITDQKQIGRTYPVAPLNYITLPPIPIDNDF